MPSAELGEQIPLVPHFQALVASQQEFLKIRMGGVGGRGTQKSFISREKENQKHFKCFKNHFPASCVLCTLHNPVGNV